MTKTRMGKRNDSQQGQPGDIQCHFIYLSSTEQWLLQQQFHPSTGVIRRHLVAIILPYHLHAAFAKWLAANCWEGATLVNNNLTTCSSEELNRNSFSLDWDSALNNSTVLGDLSDSRILRVSSDLFFRERRTSGRRWSTTNRNNAWASRFCIYACTPHNYMHTHSIVLYALEALR